MIGVYIHIPYCRTVCPYCDFVKRPIKGSVPREFIRALQREIDAYEGPREADAIFFGGGTPSLIEPADLETILNTVRKIFKVAPNSVAPNSNSEDYAQKTPHIPSTTIEATNDVSPTFPNSTPEITLEANPDDITPDLVAAWLDLGVNRVSLGVQSFDDAALRYLGRRHDADAARRACAIVGGAFDNWNIDLIFGVPPLEAWRDTLRECVGMQSPHVSAYGLTYEAGTPFGKRSNEAIDDDTYLREYQDTLELLTHVERYELSNFARPGFECVHNMHYWRNEEYAGFGPGAYGFINRVRARNHVKLEDYLADPGGKSESLTLPEDEIRIETLIQHLRLHDGISRTEYRTRFGRELTDDFGDTIQLSLKRGLIADDGETLRPTALGFELNNEIGLALVRV